MHWIAAADFKFPHATNFAAICLCCLPLDESFSPAGRDGAGDYG
ncbi:MAG: hypothetical protein NT086_03100 [Proteobacteria bacterium]|nr:hypothetical protein [Pseudomonadota bacterium]